MSITRDEIRALCAEHDRLMAAAAEERRMYADGRLRSGSPPERLTDGANIIYRQHDNSAPAPAPEPEQDWSAWEAWMAGHLANEREAMLDGVAEFVVTMLDRERDAFSRQLAEQRREITELRNLFQQREERATAVAEVRREHMGERAELERQRFATALAERDAKIEKLEMQMKMLCSFLSVGGYDLPKGL